tara:strand:+ start:1306 stop:1782 length:477 start_codon:yes stop_codon:yes gene_type:complete
MAKDLMRYDLMAQEALRGVVRQALLRAATPQGLPGPHHFYITFRTRAPGVDIDPSLLEKYPDEMTIVLEHQFWDLDVTDTGFEVTLKFGGVPKYLKMPYTAVSRFHDPSVGFHLQFEPSLTGNSEDNDDTPTPRPGPKSAPADGEAGQVVSLDSFRKK